ncbi:MAG: DUF4129 domain-containing protein [Desulfurococcales archaeon]|nr:DUF4129 domain-containing protein [Desulfurococcales archaeon]
MTFGRLTAILLLTGLLLPLFPVSLPDTIHSQAQKHPEELPYYIPGIYTRDDFIGILNEYYSYYAGKGEHVIAGYIADVIAVVSSETSTETNYYATLDSLSSYLRSRAVNGTISGGARAIVLTGFSVYTSDMNLYLFNTQKYSNSTLDILMPFVNTHKNRDWTAAIASLATTFVYAISTLDQSSKEYAFALNSTGNPAAMELANEGLRIYYLARMLSGMVDNETLQAIIDMYLQDGLLNESTASSLIESLNSNESGIVLNELIENGSLSSLTTLAKGVDAYSYLNQTGLNVEDVLEALATLSNMNGTGKPEVVNDFQDLDKLFEGASYPKPNMENTPQPPSLNIPGAPSSLTLGSPNLSSLVGYLLWFFFMLALLGVIYMIYTKRNAIINSIIRFLPWGMGGLLSKTTVSGSVEEVKICYREAVKTAGKIGFTKMPWETPREHANRLPVWLQGVMDDIIRIYEKARYGHVTPSPKEVESCFEMLRRLYEVARSA